MPTITYDANSPAVAQDHATVYTPGIRYALRAIASGLDPTYVSYANPIAGFKRINGGVIEQYNGASWGTLPVAYTNTAADRPLIAKLNRYHTTDSTSVDTARNEHGMNYSTGGSGLDGPFVSYGPLSKSDTVNYQLQLTGNYVSGNRLKFRTNDGSSGTWNTWRDVWNSGYQGAGTGMDADKVDGFFGRDASNYWQIDNHLRFTDSTKGIYYNDSAYGASGVLVTPSTVAYGALSITGVKGSYTGFHFASSFQNRAFLSHTGTGATGMYAVTPAAFDWYYDPSASLFLVPSGAISGTRFYSGYDSGLANSFNTSNWFRSSGTTGWFNATYATGIYSRQSGIVDTFGSSNFRVEVTDASLYPSITLRNRGVNSSSHTIGALLWDAYRDVADPAYAATIYVNATTPAALSSPAMFFGVSPGNPASGVIPAAVMSLDGSGNLYCTGNVTAFSDERLKRDHHPFYLSMEQMLSIEHTDYEVIDTGARQVGAKAQQVKRVSERFVSEGLHQGRRARLSVDYGRLGTALGLSLAREVAALRAEVAELRSAV
jgi:hypothetical protein